MYSDDRTGSTLDRIRSTAGSAPPNASTLRCPWCRKVGVLVSRGTDLTNGEMQSEHMRFAGVRHCPDPQCGGLVFVVVDHHGTVLDSFPRERIDLDRSGIPEPVLDRLDEAVVCHAAGAPIAAGAMLRAALEAMCDEQGVTGSTLRARVDALTASAGATSQYGAALEALRLVGDAPSVTTLVADLGGVDDASVRDAIEVVKSLVALVYQHDEVRRILERHNPGAHR